MSHASSSILSCLRLMCPMLFHESNNIDPPVANVSSAIKYMCDLVRKAQLWSVNCEYGKISPPPHSMIVLRYKASRHERTLSKSGGGSYQVPLHRLGPDQGQTSLGFIHHHSGRAARYSSAATFEFSAMYLWFLSQGSVD